MGQAERIQYESAVAAQASAAYRSRGIPADWYVDPADPDAHERYQALSANALEEAATAFLTEHAVDGDALVDDLDEPEDESDEPADEAIERALALLASPADHTPKGVLIDLLHPGEPEEGELAWQAEALCAQTDPEAFFPEKGGSTRDAKKVCGSCTVRAQCLEYALANDERFGIWGGLSERERRRLRKRAV
ncbi:WhiB family transcriptional regulator [Sinomonas sp. R1AF57]|uniref:WhiB family transcriptional regulator n=1 Tax=Sinomonas sp. R1AF57 TaxID=2020377 RepID=UPI000B603919|nr:WhiB family transcriptional regulator [Sinomonas sp. R1AF57]ASN51445.1 transcription factor WhiB [Sinomonas sp. R1AF57]